MFILMKNTDINEEKSLSYNEMKDIISKAWLNCEDIMKLANCGKHSATNIRNEIEKQIIDSGKKVPKSLFKCVPTHLVLEYLVLNADYICEMANKFA